MNDVCVIQTIIIAGKLHAQHGYIAQWLERLTADQQVPGSNPGVPSFFSACKWIDFDNRNKKPMMELVAEGHFFDKSCLHRLLPCISGLVVEYIVAIDVTRVRFPADAFLLLID